jgi:Flp pilus assembly protein protease CpaA
MTGVGEPTAFIVMMQLISLGMAAFGGAWMAGAFATLRLSPQSYTIATALPVLLAWSIATLPLPPIDFLWSLVLVASLVALAMVDAKLRAVPDSVSVPVIVLGILQAASIGGPYHLHAIAALGLIFVAIGVATMHPRALTWVGTGDVLIVTAAMAWFGPLYIPDLALLAGLILSVQLMLRRIPLPEPDACMPTQRYRGSRLTLGPALVAAQLTLWFGGSLI